MQMKCKHAMIPQSCTRSTVRTSGECVLVISPSRSLSAWVWSSGGLDYTASKTPAPTALLPAELKPPRHPRHSPHMSKFPAGVDPDSALSPPRSAPAYVVPAEVTSTSAIRAAKLENDN